MRFLSLFAGIGGMDLGLERAGMECVGQVEIDPYCRRVLTKHWPNVWRHDDVMTFDPNDAPQFDMIAAGFPCQDVSNAGKRAGISAPRSGLYREVVRCLRVARPRVAVLENVAALLSRGIGTVLGDLAAIGYDAEWDCVPAIAFGALHQRNRVFIRATRADTIGERRQWCGGGAVPAQWQRHELERLVQDELRVSVPAGQSGGVSDGIPNRAHRLRGLGNAVVPQVAEYVGRVVMGTMKEAV